jgi:ectoine hydroxylase-related dioxygenase (phytanoyl-CoA dioxygenase family)
MPGAVGGNYDQVGVKLAGGPAAAPSGAKRRLTAWLSGLRADGRAPTRLLSADEIAAFHRDGFLTIPAITTAEELDTLRDAYDRLFEEARGWKDGSLFDLVDVDRGASEARSPQLLNPSRFEPLLRDILFRTNATAMCRQLLGPTAGLVFEHAIRKPPKIGAATSWHQDEAFYEVFTNYRAITVWMPLQEVTPENGCMLYIPGSHREPLLPHRSIGGDTRIHGLEAIGVPAERAVPCPLPAGGATFHDCRTLHCAGPNLSAGPRRAYALGFGVRAAEHTLRQEHPWNAEKRTHRQERERLARGPLARLAAGAKQQIKALVR